MKQNLSKLLILSMVVLAAGSFSCKKESGLPVNPVITVDPADARVENAAGTIEVELISNSDWTALVDGDASSWVTITPSKGGASEETQKVSITVTENTDNIARVATIKFAHTRGVAESVFKLTQGPKLTALEKDSLALIDLYNATKGYQWKQAWDIEMPINTWAGITLDVVDGDMRVVKMDGANQFMNGKLPESLEVLTGLHTFIITDGVINQELPLFVTKWPRLTFLALGSSGFYGTIPDAYYDMVQLTRMDLNHNALTGPVSPKIGQLVNITDLFWNNNKFGGTLPKEIGLMKACEDFRMDFCELEGEIPTEIGNLDRLYSINFDGNHLTGEIPASISNLKLIGHIDLVDNKFTGNLPLLEGCDSLFDIRVSYNNITGSLPETWGNLKKLETVQAMYNKISGSIPQSWANLKYLSAIVLDHNELTGEIPAFVGEKKTISLGCNKLSGEIPAEILNSVIISDLDLDSNQLTAVIPETFFSNNQSMQSLSLRGMKGVTGQLPDVFTSAFGLKSIKLDGSGFSGPIPRSIFLPNDIQTISLRDNDFSGNIPTELASSRILASFACSGNKLNGELDAKIKAMANWSFWKPEINICPQQEGFVLTGCE